MAIFFVSSSSELIARMATVSSGDTIFLAPGTYEPLTVRNLGDLGITIASADPDNPAVLTGVVMSDVGDVRFSNLIMSAGVGENNAFRFESTHALTFSGIVVHGPDNVGSGEEVSPLLIRSSTDITVVDSEFYNAFHALKLLDVDGIIISGNEFHDIRCDGIRGGGVSNAVVSGNFFTNFYPIGNDHPDAIQFWSTNQAEAAHNLVITDNLVIRGDGGPTQGIFIRDTNDSLPFENVTINGNVILGGLYNGISVDGVIGGEVTNNLVIGYPDQRSWIRVNMDVNFDVSANAATAYSFDERDSAHYDTNWEITENIDFYTNIVESWRGSGSDLSVLSNSLLSAAVFDALPIYMDAAGQSSASTQIVGSWANDELFASVGGSRVDGRGGHDLLHGSDASDVLSGGGGHDVLIGNVGSDTLWGGSGRDILRGGADRDDLYGGEGSDELIGGEGDDLLFGGNGADNLVGGEGDDWLFGGAGFDLLVGGAGNDCLLGSQGDDILIGGTGADWFIFNDKGWGNGNDTILDFVSGQDVISLKGIDAISYTSSDDAFRFIGTSAFSGSAGELRIEHVANGLMVLGDTNGDGIPDFQLMVEGVDTLSGSDFIF